MEEACEVDLPYPTISREGHVPLPVPESTAKWRRRVRQRLGVIEMSEPDETRVQENKISCGALCHQLIL